MAAVDAIEVLVATSLADSLSRYPFSTAIAPVMEYVPDFERLDATALRVSVVPGNVEVTEAARGANLHEVTVNVVFAKAITANSELGELSKLRAEVADKIRSDALPASDPVMPYGMQFVSLENPVLYDAKSVTSGRIFLAEIAVTYRGLVEKHEA
jgi:hypothetical protein